MNINPIQMGAAPLVAAALGRVLGVKVVLSATARTAMTDRKTIILPMLPVTLPEWIATIVWGFIHHEAGHCRHTDFDVRIDNWQELQADQLLDSLLSILEDIRMECAHIRFYPGAARILAELVEALVAIGFFKPLPQDADMNHTFHDFVLKHLRCTMLGQAALHDQVQLSRTVLEQQMGVGFVTRLVAELQPILTAADTTESLNLAYRIRQFLKEEIEAQQPPTPPATGDEQSTPGSPGNDEPAGSSNSSDTTEEADDDDNTSTSAGSSDTQDEDNGDTASASSDQSDDIETDAQNALKQILKGGDLDDSLGDLGDALSEMLNDSIEAEAGRPVTLPSDDRRKDGHRDSSAIAKARSVSSRLAIQLKRQLESCRDVASEPTRRGKRISRRHITRVAFKDYRIFQHKQRLPEVNTAVVSLIDASGSMADRVAGSSKRVIDVASDSILATSLALGTISHLSHAVGAFPSTRGSDHVELILDFPETVEPVSSRFALSPRGSTPLAEALLWAADRLLQRSEERRIIFVATDGHPDDVTTTKDILNHLRRQRIEVHGLGIQSDDPYDLFDSFVKVEDVNDLPQSFLSLFQRLLRRTA